MQVVSDISGKYWQWRGHSIYYVQAGDKQSTLPPLLLIHGFGASTDHWRKNIAELKKVFSVWAIDLLGFGRSAKPTIEYSANLWREQLHDFIQEVIGKPVVLAGNSLGGYAALSIAAEHPSQAAGLILINSAGPFTEPEKPQPSNPIKEKISQVVRSLFLQPAVSFFLFQYLRRPAIIRKTLKQVYIDHSAVTDQLVEDIYRPSCDRGAAYVFASVFKSREGKKVDVLLQQLNCPLLMLWGEGDPWMNARERGSKFIQHYPSLQQHYLHAGHCPHDEIPEEVNALIRSWVLSTLSEAEKLNSLR